MRITSMLAITGWIAAAAIALVAAPDAAEACGSGEEGCGIVEWTQVIEDSADALEVKIHGAFAWGYPDWMLEPGESEVTGQMFGFIQPRCETSDEWCMERLQELLDAESTGATFIFYGSYGDAWGDKPPFIFANSEEGQPLEGSWQFPYVQPVDQVVNVKCRKVISMGSAIHIDETLAATRLEVTPPTLMPLVPASMNKANRSATRPTAAKLLPATRR